MSSDTTPASRIAWWFVSCVIGGWLIVYNILRLGGDYPSEAATPALVGGFIGAVVFVAGWILVRRGAFRKGASLHAAAERPTSGALGAWKVAAIACAVSAAVTLAVAAAMALDYFGLPSGERPKSTVLLVAWGLVFSVWVAEEAVRVLRTRDVELIDVAGFDAVWFACLLTCVLAGVAYSRDLMPGLQMAVVACAGIAGAAVAWAQWHHRGGRGLPVTVAVPIVVAVASLALPALI